MIPIRTIPVLSVLFLVLMAWSCAPKISQEAALDIAKTYMAQDSLITLDLSERREEIVSEKGVWHVSFPLKASANKVGGEPHFFIDQKTGEIIETFYTR